MTLRLAHPMLVPLALCALAALPLQAAIQETFDLGANWQSPDSWTINPGSTSSGSIYLYMLDGQGNAVTPFSGTVQSLVVSIRNEHFWDTGSIGGVNPTQTHDGGPYGTTYHSASTSVCTLPMAISYYPVSPSQVSYTTAPSGVVFKSSYTGDPGLPQIPVSVTSTGGFNVITGLYAIDVGATLTHYPNLNFSTDIKWIATVVASSIVLNTTSRTLSVGWYHDFLSKTSSNGFPDSYAMGAARILSSQVNPDGSSILQFASDNPSVCTVDAKGHVVAVAPGTCHVTVTCDSAPAQVATFTVTGPPVIKGGVVRINKGGSTVDLTSRITASGSTPTTVNISGAFGATITWTNSGHSVAWPNAGWGAVSIAPSAGYNAGDFTVSITDDQGHTGASQTIFWGVGKDPLGPSANPWLPDAIAANLQNDAQVGGFMIDGVLLTHQQLPGHPPDAHTDSADPVCYANGEMRMYEDDLDMSGVTGGISLRRSYSNLVLSPDSQLGMSWNLDAQPRVFQSPDLAYMQVVTRADAQVSFVNNGNNTYTAIRSNPSTLVAANGNTELVYTDVNGLRIDFYGFSASPAALQGRAKHVFMPGAARIEYAYDASGLLSTITRTISSTESDVIAFANDGQGRATLIQRIHQVGAQATVVRQAEYQYYAGIAGDYGDNGTLRFVRVRDGQGGLLRQFYYRYYRAGDATGSLGQIKYAVGPRQCELMFKATGQDVFAVTMSDAQLSTYADKAFQYENASGRVVQQVLQTPDLDGSGTFTYAYQPRAVTTPGPNDWLMRTTETLPDNSQNVVYTNQQGQILLKATKASSGAAQQWIDAYRYDGNWHMTWHITPAAMQQSGGVWYNEANTDLLGYVANGTSPYVQANTGLIEVFTYYTTTDGAGAVAGYPQYLQRQVGQSGTPYMVKKWTYTAHTAP